MPCSGAAGRASERKPNEISAPADLIQGRHDGRAPSIDICLRQRKAAAARCCINTPSGRQEPLATLRARLLRALRVCCCCCCFQCRVRLPSPAPFLLSSSAPLIPLMCASCSNRVADSDAWPRPARERPLPSPIACSLSVPRSERSDHARGYWTREGRDGLAVVGHGLHGHAARHLFPPVHTCHRSSTFAGSRARFELRTAWVPVCHFRYSAARRRHRWPGSVSLSYLF